MIRRGLGVPEWGRFRCRRGMARGFGWGAALVGGLLAAAPGPGAAQTDRPEVVELDIRGNEVFRGDSLRAAIVNRETECRLPGLVCALGIDLRRRNYLQPRELPLDVLRLEYYYRQRGYREASVDTLVERTDGRVRLAFVINEGEPVRIDSLEVLLWDEVADTSLVSDLEIGPGDALDDLRLDAARDSLTARLRDNGYANAEVLVSNFVPAGSRLARVTFDVYPGPTARFGPVEVFGNRELDSLSVVRMLPFATGDLYRARQVVEGQRNLYGLELIQSARIVERLEPGDTVVPLEVFVGEGQLHRVRTGVGWTTLDCLNAEAQWASRNFVGGARRLTVRGRVSNILAEELNSSACSQAGSGRFAELNGQVSVELVQPWFLSPRNTLSASAFFERQSVPNVFVRRALGLNLSASRTLGRRAVLSLGYQPTLTQLDAAEVFLCSSFLACLPSDLRVFRESNWLSGITARLTQDWRNSVLNPSSGYYWLLDLEHARDYTGSDFAFDRVALEGSAYHQAGSFVLAARVRAGLVGSGSFLGAEAGGVELVHPQKRFFSGGANSVRGFAENELGPRMLTTSVEQVLGVPEGQSVPVCQPEQLAVGADLGQLGMCDPSALPDEAFAYRPVGGTWVAEANVELRFPLFIPDLQGVVFFDAGQVWVGRSEASLRDLATSPGVGVRYMSPIGPIRVDLGYGSRPAERLPVAVSQVRPWDAETDSPTQKLVVRDADGSERVLEWVATNDLDFLFPSRSFGDSGSLLSKLQLHISLGQAF